MTDTQLDLDAILAAHASASPYGRTEVAGRFHASYYADDADVALVFASIPALIAALRKAEAQVAHWEQAAIDASSEVEGYRTGLAAQVVTRERDASRTAHAALVADLRALVGGDELVSQRAVNPDEYTRRTGDRVPSYLAFYQGAADLAAVIRALLDRHDPTTGETP